MRRRSRVIVGVDGSQPANDALNWAAAEASLRRCPLLIAHCWVLLPLTESLSPLDPRVEKEWAEHATGIVEDAAARVRSAVPAVSVATQVVGGFATDTLPRLAQPDDLLVVGARGLGSFRQLLLGSVSREVAARANSPVVVIRGAGRRAGRIVVGVDGSERSLRAVEFAFAEASLRGASLVAVHAWDLPRPAGHLGLSLQSHLRAVEKDELVAVQETLAGWREDHPDVQLEEKFIHLPPVDALVQESINADLLVVGARGRGATTGLLLGSVAHAMLRHATSPVAVVHDAIAED